MIKSFVIYSFKKHHPLVSQKIMLRKRGVTQLLREGFKKSVECSTLSLTHSPKSVEKNKVRPLRCKKNMVYNDLKQLKVPFKLPF